MRTTLFQGLSVGTGIAALAVMLVCLVYYPDSNDLFFRYHRSGSHDVYAQLGTPSCRALLLRESENWLNSQNRLNSQLFETGPLQRIQAFQTVLNGLARLGIVPDPAEHNRYFSSWQKEAALIEKQESFPLEYSFSAENAASVEETIARLLAFSQNTPNGEADESLSAAVEFMHCIEQDDFSTAFTGDSLYLTLLANKTTEHDHPGKNGPDAKCILRNPLNRLVCFDSSEVVSFSPQLQRYEARMSFAGFLAICSLLSGLPGIFSIGFFRPLLADSQALLLRYYERLTAVLSTFPPAPAVSSGERFYRYDNTVPVGSNTDLDTIRLLN